MMTTTDGPVEVGELAAQLAHVVRHAETVRHLQQGHGEAFELIYKKYVDENQLTVQIRFWIIFDTDLKWAVLEA